VWVNPAQLCADCWTHLSLVAEFGRACDIFAYVSGGFTRQGLEQFRDVAARHVGDDRVPGLVALVARGDDVHVEALGELDIGGRPVARDSLFRIASTTKPITAAATLALVDEGLLELDEPVQRVLPELADRRVLVRMDGPLQDTVPARRPITVRDLLTFTFGFGMVGAMFTAAPPWPVVEAARALHTIGPPAPDAQPDPDAWIAGLGTLPLMAQPGERWMYNTGASVLGVMCARAANEPFGDVLSDRILEPLGMDDTAFWTSDTDRLATAYQPTPEGLVERDHPDGAWSEPPAFPDGAAGLVSSVDDLLAFGRMLLADGDGVLSAQAAVAMRTDQLTPEQKSLGGLGPDFFAHLSWSYGQAVHDDRSFGWDGGLGTSWRVDPVRDLIVIVLTQRHWERAEPPQVHRDILAAARAALA
jgi:CubicO group peptidase (beta-lactamase class C family)